MRNPKLLVISVILAFAASSCGGGGSTGSSGGSQGGGGGSTSSTPVPTIYVTGVASSINELPGIAALQINSANGALSAVAGSPFATNVGGYAIAVDPTGTFAYTAQSNYIVGYSIMASTGALSELSSGPFFTNSACLSMAIDPTGKLLFTANLSTGSISGFRINADGSLTALNGSPFVAGSLPSAIIFDPVSPYLYVANAQDDSITAYAYDVNAGTLTLVPGSPVSTNGQSRSGSTPQSLAIDPSGKYLFVADFSSSAISVFSINSTTGVLSEVVGSPFSAYDGADAIAVDSSGKWLFVADGLSVHSFAIDSTSGSLTELPNNPSSGTNQRATALSIDSSGKYLYSLDNTGSELTAYSIDTSTGALSLVAGDPFQLIPGGTAVGAIGLAVSP